MVVDIRSTVILFVIELIRLSSKKSKASMLIGVSRTVKKDNINDRVEFKNKRANISENESMHQNSNVNQSSFQHKKKGPAPSSDSAPAPKNKCEYNS